MRSVTSTSDPNFQNIGGDMAERLGLGPEVRQLKLGPTFTSNRSTAFHTLKYDFKPASVDVSKMARVDVGTNNTMTVTVPHLDGAGIPHTVFKGSQRPYHKECVLIIDRVTGEITLEKLSSNIQVKKTRAETKTQSFLTVPSSNNGNRPITPVEFRRSPTHGRATGRTKVASGKKREPSIQLHPKQPHSPHQLSPYHGKSPPNLPNSSVSAPTSTVPSTLASLPIIGIENEDYAPTSSLPSSSPHCLTSGISSPGTTVKPVATMDSDECALSDSSSSTSSSDSSDSDSEADRIRVPMPINGDVNDTSSPSLSMPDNLLNDDLQLSESESDSD
ncbi:ell-associated factor Eaf [Orussus abietinus]|uniref:ell-associated factor Eaf n=1 Tax=Orussus abietinus TaxID=222816 RepID=UPI0006251F5B|nr:ell-associated factor Eaf [Orussus abietinus]